MRIMPLMTTMIFTTTAMAGVTPPDVGIAIELVGSGLLDAHVEDVETNRTIRLVAVMPTGWRLDAVAGNSEQDLLLQCNNGTFWQTASGGPTSTSINSALFQFFPELEFDSFATVGALDQDGAPYPANAMNSIGLNWTDFEDSGGAITGDNGTWFITPSDDQGEQFAFTDTCGKVRTGVTIAQLTLLGDGATVSFSGLLQGKDDLGESWQAFFTVFETTADDRSPADISDSCSGDLDGDDVVNVDDLLSMLSNWYGNSCLVDLTLDDVVDTADVIELITQWGACPTE